MKKTDKNKVLNNVYDAEWVADNCAHVIRTLPGGVDIVGETKIKNFLNFGCANVPKSWET